MRTRLCELAHLRRSLCALTPLLRKYQPTAASVEKVRVLADYLIGSQCPKSGTFAESALAKS